MKINLNTNQGIQSFLFPDGQPHVRLDNVHNTLDKEADVTCSITSSHILLKLQMLANALDTHFIKKCELFIPYLMGARFDRVMEPGDSFDLKVIAGIINGLGFEKVILLDPHSDVAPALIDRVEVIDNRLLVGAYDKPNAILVVPDAGASKKSPKYLNWNGNITASIQVEKHRDVHTGKLSLAIPGGAVQCINENVVIIDDLCDGGGTFLAIADIIKPFEPKSLTLIVTHGVFSKNALIFLCEKFDKIIVSNSYQEEYPRMDKVQIVRYEL